MSTAEIAAPLQQRFQEYKKIGFQQPDICLTPRKWLSYFLINVLLGWGLLLFR